MVAAVASPQNRQAVLWPASRVEWKDIPDIEGVKRSVIWGNPERTAFGALEKMPGGTSFPLHWHTYDARVVVVAGSLLVGLEGRPAQKLGPGSYCFLPGGSKHTRVCKAAEDCVFFVMRSGVDDTKWVGEK
jgi:quercetin dioxygenase-like cupin family protein